MKWMLKITVSTSPESTLILIQWIRMAEAMFWLPIWSCTLIWNQGNWTAILNLQFFIYLVPLKYTQISFCYSIHSSWGVSKGHHIKSWHQDTAVVFLSRPPGLATEVTPIRKKWHCTSGSDAWHLMRTWEELPLHSTAALEEVTSTFLSAIWIPSDLLSRYGPFVSLGFA